MIAEALESLQRAGYCSCAHDSREALEILQRAGYCSCTHESREALESLQRAGYCYCAHDSREALEILQRAGYCSCTHDSREALGSLQRAGYFLCVKQRYRPNSFLRLMFSVVVCPLFVMYRNQNVNIICWIGSCVMYANMCIFWGFFVCVQCFVVCLYGWTEVRTKEKPEYNPDTGGASLEKWKL